MPPSEKHSTSWRGKEAIKSVVDRRVTRTKEANQARGTWAWRTLNAAVKPYELLKI